MSDPLAPIALATIRDGERCEIEADAATRAVIAERLDLPAVDRFRAEAVLERDGDEVGAVGSLRAKVVQACVATGDPLEADVDERFALHFAPQPRFGEEEEVELGADDLDIIFHDGREVALGDALVDTLALALDPFPRSPDAEKRLREAGVLSEEEAGKFGALAELRKKMEGGGA